MSGRFPLHVGTHAWQSSLFAAGVWVLTPKDGGMVVEYDPPLARAVEDQLGLRLEYGRVPVEYLVIDHVERPSENWREKER